jgi:hypothetical protein
VRVTLGAPERKLLEVLALEVRPIIEHRDLAAARLFPVAHPGDPEAEQAWVRMAHDSLSRHHLGALDQLARQVHATAISEEDLERWAHAVEALRLVVGTQLGVEEGSPELDPAFEPDLDDPAHRRVVVYRYLTWLQAQAVDVLASRLERRRPNAHVDAEGGEHD